MVFALESKGERRRRRSRISGGGAEVEAEVRDCWVCCIDLVRLGCGGCCACVCCCCFGGVVVAVIARRRRCCLVALRRCALSSYISSVNDNVRDVRHEVRRTSRTASRFLAVGSVLLDDPSGLRCELVKVLYRRSKSGLVLSTASSIGGNIVKYFPIGIDEAKLLKLI